MVIERVESIAAKQGYKSLKFFNRKKEEMRLRDADLLEGVSGDVIDENFSSLPDLDYEAEEEDSDDELEADEGISNEEIADLLDDEIPDLLDPDDDEIPELRREE